VARGGRDRTWERDQLRERLLQQGRTREQIAAAMTQEFGDRPRVAWRHAHGWTQKDVAARYNEEIHDQQQSVTANRISDYERWPRKGGRKPTVPVISVLAKVYSTRALNLIDSHDRRKFDAGELLALSAVEFMVAPHQLPGAIPNFVGRAHELKMLTSQLDKTVLGGGNTVVITSIGGTAGVGKTTLAVHWARRHRDQFPHGQLYVDLRGFAPSGTPLTPETVIRGFLDSFHVPTEKIPIGFDAQMALYRTLVEDKKLVIVLDNARDADQVWPLLPGSPTCTVLVTSRQQLGSLIARNQATQITLELFTNEEAQQLLTSFLGAKRIDAEPDAVNELIQRCVGLPIALSIAAARILLDPHLPLSTLVGQLREENQQLDALSTGDNQLTDIRAVLSWSYTTLSEQAARLFRLLGMHPGPDIGTLAAASLAGLSKHNTHELLTELLRASLLEEHTPGRYRLHDLLRAYAAEQARIEESEPQQRAALHRVLDYYLHTSFTANQRLDPHQKMIVLEAPQPGVIPGQAADYEQAMNWLTAERAVLLSATNYAAAHGFDSHAWRLTWTLVTFLYRQGHWHDNVAIQHTALAAAKRLGDRAAQALAHCDLGYAQTRLEHHTDALANLEQALALHEELGDRDSQAHTHGALAWVYEKQHQYDQALTHAQKALTLSRAAGHDVGQARALNNVGWYYALLGQYQQTLIYCQQALNLNRKLGEPVGEAQTLDSLGYAHHHLGHHNQAITYYQHALTLRHELGDHYSEAVTLTHLADTHHATGNVAAARTAWQQALIIFDDLGHSDADNLRAKLAALDTPSDTSTNDPRT
jgi:tetratricopeptide (TPR) repeat protein